MAGKALLYSSWYSSCSWRVRIGLAYKGIEYDMKSVDLLKGGYLNEEGIHPMKQIPAISIDGHTFFESLSILHYLEETRPNKPLMPSLDNPIDRMKVREICDIIVAGIQPLQNFSVLKRVGEEKKDEWVNYFINRGLQAIEKLLEEWGSKNFCVGEDLTFADCCLVPQVFNARWRYKMDINKYPNIERIEKSLLLLPEFKKTHPFAQPDCPEDLKMKS